MNLDIVVPIFCLIAFMSPMFIIAGVNYYFARKEKHQNPKA